MVSRNNPCTNSRLHIQTLEQGRIQILWCLKLIKFWGSLREKEYKITSTKLGKKVNIYLERGKKSQQITNLK